jgi:hypothetical protein
MTSKGTSVPILMYHQVSRRIPVLGGESLCDFVGRLHTAQNAAELMQRIRRRISIVRTSPPTSGAVP